MTMASTLEMIWDNILSVTITIVR